MNKTLSELLDRGLSAGKHSAGSAECCAVEAINLAKGRPKSDNVWAVGGFDFRRINDSSIWRDNTDRAEGMRGICVAYYDADSWTNERRAAVAGRIALETVRQIISELPGLGDAARQQCRDAVDLKEAYAAARAARVALAAEARVAAAEAAAQAAAEAEVAWAAWAADEAALANADAATGRDVLIKACAIWVEAARSEQ